MILTWYLAAYASLTLSMGLMKYMKAGQMVGIAGVGNGAELTVFKSSPIGPTGKPMAEQRAICAIR